MKKRILTSLTLVALMATVGFVSCSKETDPAEPLNQNIMRYTATVEGYLLIDAEVRDSISAVNPKFATPSGVSMYVTVPYSQIDPVYAANSQTQNWQGTVSYDATTGKFTATIPVGEAGAKPTFVLSDIYASNGGRIDHSYDCIVNNTNGRQDSVLHQYGVWGGGSVTSSVSVMPKQTVVLTDANPWKLSFKVIEQSGDKQ